MSQPGKLTAAQHADLATALQSGDLSATPRPVLIMLLKMVNSALDQQFPQFASVIDAGFAWVEKLLSGTP